MSTVIDQPTPDSGGLAPDTVVTPTRGSGARKLPIVLGVLTALLAVVLIRSDRAGRTTFQLAADSDFVTLPDIVVPSGPTAWVMVVVCLALTAEAVRRMLAHLRQPMWIPIVFAIAWMAGFLSWAAADGRIRMVSLLGGAVALAIPLVFGALGGVLGERAGVVNIAIEGQLLLGAFAAAITASMTGSPWVGLLAAMVAGALVALILGLFAITYFVDQVIVGVVLNVLVVGLTNFLFRQVLTPNSESLNSPERLRAIPIPILGDIPLIGPIFFRQTPLVYVLYAVVALVAFALYRTRRGLLQPGLGRRLQPRDDGRCRLHRAGRGHLRQVGPDPGDPRRAPLRLRDEPPGRALGHRVPRAEPVHADAPLRRHHLRGGGPRRALPAASGGRHPLPATVGSNHSHQEGPALRRWALVNAATVAAER